jgi:hypothetical protein
MSSRSHVDVDINLIAVCRYLGLYDMEYLLGGMKKVRDHAGGYYFARNHDQLITQHVINVLGHEEGPSQFLTP